MFAPSPMATGRCTIADHFPGNQGKSGAGLVKQFLQEAGEWIKGDILLPHILLPFFFFFPGRRKCLPSPDFGKALCELGSHFSSLSLYFLNM